MRARAAVAEVTARDQGGIHTHSGPTAVLAFPPCRVGAFLRRATRGSALENRAVQG